MDMLGNDELRKQLEGLFGRPIADTGTPGIPAALEMLRQQELERQLQAQVLDTATPVVQQEVSVQQVLQMDGKNAVTPAQGINPREVLPDGWEATSQQGIYSRKNAEGVKEFTNVKDDKGAPTMTPPASYFSGGPMRELTAAEAVVPGNLAQRFKQLQETEGLEARMQLLAQTNAEVAAVQAKINQDSLAQANQKLGVDKLEALLAQNEAADRAHPQWSKMQSDSRQTASVRSQLESARTKAASMAEVFTKQNPQAVQLDAMAKGMGTIIQKQYEEESRKRAREDNAELRAGERRMAADIVNDQKMAMKQYEQEMKVQTVMAQFKPQQFERFRMLNPDMAAMSNESIAQVLAAGKKAISPVEDAVLKAGSPDLLRMAAMSNQQAAEVLVRETALNSQVPEETLKTKVATFQRNMTPEAMRVQLEKAFAGKTDTPEYKDAMNELKSYRSGMMKDDEKKAFAGKLFNSALAGLETQNTAEWAGNLGKGWVMPEGSAMRNAYDKVRVSNGNQPVSLMDVVRQVRSDVPRDQWRAISEQMRDTIFANRPYEDSPLTRVNAAAMFHRVQEEFSRGMLSGLMDSAALHSGKVVQTMVNEPLFNQSVVAGYNYLFGNPIK